MKCEKCKKEMIQATITTEEGDGYLNVLVCDDCKLLVNVSVLEKNLDKARRKYKDITDGYYLDKNGN